MKRNLGLILVLLFGFTSCMPKNLKNEVAEILKNNPEILAEAITKNPGPIFKALSEASKEGQKALAKEREDEEKKRFDESFSNPLKPEIRPDETVRGTAGAPIVIVEYSDFQCPFCTRGYETVTKLLGKYEGKIQFIYKHLPLSFHDKAMIAAQYYEAIRLQDPKKAFAFHDEIFSNQQKLQLGESFLKGAAKKVGADLEKVAKDINSEKVKARIEQDMKEADAFEMKGTPGFLVNGVPVRGAYPLEHFDMIINKLKEMGKISI